LAVRRLIGRLRHLEEKEAKTVECAERSLVRFVDDVEYVSSEFCHKGDHRLRNLHIRLTFEARLEERGDDDVNEFLSRTGEKAEVRGEEAEYAQANGRGDAASKRAGVDIATGKDVERLNDLPDAVEPFGVGGKAETADFALVEDSLSVTFGEVRGERNEEGEDGVGRTGEIVAASPSSDELSEEGDEGGEDSRSLSELGAVAARLLVLGFRVCREGSVRQKEGRRERGNAP
jgi:hypothetical protein